MWAGNEEMDSPCHSSLPDPADRDDWRNKNPQDTGDGDQTNEDWIWFTESVMIRQVAQRTLEISQSGSGTIIPYVGTHIYGDGKVVELNAEPASCWEFTGWTGSGTPAIANPGSPNTTITMDGDYFIQATFAPITPGTIIYVNGDAAGANNGTSWTNAYTNLRQALDSAEAGQEIWVASGTYTPAPPGQPGTRTDSFQMKNEVGIYGGFVGTETERSQRDWEANKTILSGEIGNPGTITDNCYHVFYHPEGTNLDSTAILDGFTITGGNADGYWRHDNGGGMHNESSAPSITNCRFLANSAGYGGGMINWDSSPALTNCTFSGNSAGYEGGGGMYNYLSDPEVTSCIFTSNSAYDGAAMHNDESDPQLVNCNFSRNSAVNGGGMYNDSSSPVLTNCIFSENSAVNDGGGMCNDSSSPVLTNCIFSGNSAVNDGGGIYSYALRPQVTNCILWGNTASGAGDEIYNYVSYPVVTYCDIQVNPGSPAYPGAGNISADPMFVNPGSGDFHLQSISPCIDSGSNAAIQATGVTEDFEGDDRIIDGKVDMGVDETPWSPWTCLAYDSNSSGEIEYAEMIDALMDYLTSGISYSQMIDVLMCYLTS